MNFFQKHAYLYVWVVCCKGHKSLRNDNHSYMKDGSSLEGHILSRHFYFIVCCRSYGTFTICLTYFNIVRPNECCFSNSICQKTFVLVRMCNWPYFTSILMWQMFAWIKDFYNAYSVVMTLCEILSKTFINSKIVYLF